MKGAINETVERRNFRKRQQFARESFDDALRDRIIEGLLNGDTVKELLRQKDLALSKTMQVCRAHEAAKQQRLEITGNSPEIGVTSAYKAKRQQRSRLNKIRFREIRRVTAVVVESIDIKN